MTFFTKESQWARRVHWSKSPPLMCRYLKIASSRYDVRIIKIRTAEKRTVVRDFPAEERIPSFIRTRARQ